MTQDKSRRMKYLWAVGILHRDAKGRFAPKGGLSKITELEGTKRQGMRALGKAGKDLKVGETSSTYQVKIGDKTYPIKKDKNESVYPVIDGKMVGSSQLPEGTMTLVRVNLGAKKAEKTTKSTSAKVNSSNQSSVLSKEDLQMIDEIVSKYPNESARTTSLHKLVMHQNVKEIARLLKSGDSMALVDIEIAKSRAHTSLADPGEISESVRALDTLSKFAREPIEIDENSLGSLRSVEFDTSSMISKRFQEEHRIGETQTTFLGARRSPSIIELLEERIVKDLMNKYPDRFIDAYKGKPLVLEDLQPGGRFEKYDLGQGVTRSVVLDEKTRVNQLIARQDFREEYQARVKSLISGLQGADQALKSVLDSAEVLTRTTPGALEKILDSGRIKSQLETNTSKGKKDFDLRKRVDKRFFDFPEDGDLTKRPIYGYMGDRSGKDSEPYLSQDGETTFDKAVVQYGDVIIALKPSVRTRTTVTLGDSLDMNGGYYGYANLIPTPLTQPQVLSQSAEMIKYFSKDRPRSIINLPTHYTEAQIHGGVRVEDIAHVTFRTGSKPTKKMQQRLEALGITWEFGPQQKVKY